MVMTESNRSPSCRPAAWDGEGAAVGAVLDAAVGDGVADSMSDADPASSDSALFPQALIIVSSRADIKIRDNMEAGFLFCFLIANSFASGTLFTPD